LVVDILPASVKQNFGIIESLLISDSSTNNGSSYTCGAVWRTCACTELDQARRQQEIIDRRAERDRQSAADVAAAAAEAAEVAAAIAAVERQEREEEERRLREEQQRREEEERRRELEAAAARLKEQARLQLLNKKSFEFRTLLHRIHKAQRDALVDRHIQETNRLHADIESSSLAFTARQNLLRLTLRQNLKIRLQTLTEEQTKALTTVTSRHEEEEDDLFVRMTTHLRSKPNREAREKSMVEKLKKSQEEELAALEEEQKAKRDELEWMGGIESRNLEDNLRLKREEECCQEGDRVATLVRTTWAERKWFEVVFQRREEMIGEWREQAAASGLDLSSSSLTTGAEAEGPVELGADATTARAASILTRKPPAKANSNAESSSSNSPASTSASTPDPEWPLSSAAASAALNRRANVTNDLDPLMQRQAPEIKSQRVERIYYPATEVNGRVARVY
jgi:hypothetical protein